MTKIKENNYTTSEIAELEERSKVLFNSEWVTPEVNAFNQQAWVNSVRQLGTNWLFHKSNMVGRKG